MSVLIDAYGEYIALNNNSKWMWTPVTENRALSFMYYSTDTPDASQEVNVVFRNHNGDRGLQVQIYYTGSMGLTILATLFTNGYTITGYFYAANLQTVITESAWHSIVVNLSSSGNCSCYVDKQSQTVVYQNWASIGQITDPYMNWINHNVRVDGNYRLAHWAWFDKNLSINEIAGLHEDPMTAVKSSLASNCMAYFPMDEGTGTTIYDKTTAFTATDGILTDGPTWDMNPPLAKQGGLYIPQRPIIRPAPIKHLGI